MGLFSSSKSTSVTQIFDERFILDPTSGSLAYGQSGDSSILSAPGSIAVGSASNWQIAGLTLQNFDPKLIDAAYSALAENTRLLGDISAGFYESSESVQARNYDLAKSAAENAKDAAAGQTFDITELAAWAGILGFVWMMVK